MAIKAAKPEVGPSRANESTPLMVGGVLYTSTSLSQVAAIDAATGETKWVFDPKVYENGLGIPANDGWLHRGVAYWENGDDERIIMLTRLRRCTRWMPKTGKPVNSFGTDGRVDLAQGLRRPVDREYYTMSVAAGDRAQRHRGRLVGHGLVGRRPSPRRRQGI
jgi:quinoprotein glucose dehydrogenase